MSLNRRFISCLLALTMAAGPNFSFELTYYPR